MNYKCFFNYKKIKAIESLKIEIRTFLKKFFAREICGMLRTAQKRQPATAGAPQKLRAFRLSIFHTIIRNLASQETEHNALSSFQTLVHIVAVVRSQAKSIRISSKISTLDNDTLTHFGNITVVEFAFYPQEI